MKVNKRIVSLVLSGMLLGSTFSTVLADSPEAIIQEKKIDERFKIISVDKITSDKVEITIEPPKEDIIGTQVTIRDASQYYSSPESAPVIVQSIHLNIPKGTTKVIFPFKEIVLEEKLRGKWKVNGVSYYFNDKGYVSYLITAMNSNNIYKIMDALMDTRVENYSLAVLNEYQKAILENDPNTMAEVQNIIDETNRKFAEEIETYNMFLRLTQTTTVTDFMKIISENFERVNIDWSDIYTSGEYDTRAGFILYPEHIKHAAVQGDLQPLYVFTRSNVQQVIDVVNERILKEKIEEIKGTADELLPEKIQELRELIQLYMKDSEKGKLGLKDSELDLLKFKEAFISVIRSETSTELRESLTDLANLDKKLEEKYRGTSYELLFKTKFKSNEVKDNLLDYYKDEIKNTSFEYKTGIEDLNLLLEKINRRLYFSDMPNNWSTKALEKAVLNGLLLGDNGKIMPEKSLTRAEMAAIINRSFDFQEKASLANFTDISKDDWFYEDMQRAVKKGIFLGDGGELRPKENITREEAFVVLARAFEITEGDDRNLDVFPDSDKVSSWSRQQISGLISKGYVKGSDGYINPRKDIKRSEFVQIMVNLLGL